MQTQTDATAWAVAEAEGEQAQISKNIYLWQIKNVSGGNPAVIAARAHALGLKSVWIKAADGPVRYNLTLLNIWLDTIIQPVIDALAQYGIEAWAWQYNYGTSPEAEADRLLERQAKYHFAGWILDPEREYKTAGAAAANRFFSRLGDLSVPLGLSTYRYPTVHPDFPWAAFVPRVDFYAPQVYWVGATNPAQQLDRCVAEYRAMETRYGIAPKPIIPTGAAYHENGWQPTHAQIIEFFNRAKELGLPGVSFWEWGHAQRYGFEDLIASLDGGGDDTGAVPLAVWAGEIDAWARTHGYTGHKPA